MDLLKALEEKELSSDQGWSTASRFSTSNESFASLHDVPLDAWPELNRPETSDKNMSVEESHSQMWKHAMDFPGYVHHSSSKPSVPVQYYPNKQSAANQQFYSKCGSQQFDPSQSSSGSVGEDATSQHVSSQLDYLESQEAVMALQDFMENPTSSPQSSMTGTVSMDYQNTKSLFSQASRQTSKLEQTRVDGSSPQHGGSVVSALLQQQSPHVLLDSPNVKAADTSTGRAGQINQMGGLSQINHMNSPIPSQREQQQQLLRTSGNHSDSVQTHPNIRSYNQNKPFQNQQMIYSQNEQNIHSQNQQDRHPVNKNVQSLNQNIPYQHQPGQMQHGNMVTYHHQLHNSQMFQPRAQQNLHSPNVNHRGLEMAGQNMSYHQKQRQHSLSTASLNINNSSLNQSQNADPLVPSNRGNPSFSSAEPSLGVRPKSKLENILTRGQSNDTGLPSHFLQTDYSKTCESPMQNSPYYDYDGGKVCNNSNLRMPNMHNMNSPVHRDARYAYPPADNVSAQLQYHSQSSVQPQYEHFSPSSSYSSSDSQYGSQTLDFQPNRQSFSDSGQSVSSPPYEHAQYVQSGIPQSTVTNENQSYALQNQYVKHSKSLKTGQMQQKHGATVQSKVISNLKVVGGSLQKDMVYSIKSSSGKRICASWNGETFETVDRSVVQNPLDPHLSMFGENRESMLGGGAKNNSRGRPLKGNATGMHQTSSSGDQRRQGPRSKAPMLRPANYCDKAEEGSEVLLPNGRIWQHASPLTRRPLHPEREKLATGSTSTVPVSKGINSFQDQSNNDMSEAQAAEEKIPPKPPRKRFTSNGEELLAVCKFCGYTSIDLDKCERCFRRLPEDAKLTTLLKKTKTGNISQSGGSSNVTIDKKSFYGKVVSEQDMPYKNEDSVKPPPGGPQVEEDSPVGLNTKGISSVIKGKPGRKLAQNKMKPTKPRAKKSKSLVPETVTISSDEETDSNSSQAKNFALVAPVLGQSHTDAHAEAEAAPAKPEEKAEDDLPLFSVEVPKKQPVSRRGRMEDEQGRLVKKSKKTAHIEEELEMPVCDSTQEECTTVALNARSVRIGALKLTPAKNILVTDKAIHFNLSCEATEENYLIELTAHEIESCQGYLRHPLPLLFFITTPACGIKLRKQLKKGKQEFFDPKSSDPKIKYIVIIINKMEDCDKTAIRMLFKHYSMIKKNKKNIFSEMTSDESQMLLITTTPQVNDNVKNLCNRAINAKEEEKERLAASPSTLSSIEDTSEDGCRSRSASPLRIGFSGKIEKLVTYPPPPAPRGITITNEDLFCLNEGEFLNDVIIDFYLKYLYLEKLSETDRKKIHIFSSFFYKCLTQKQPRNSLPEDVAKKSPAVRRHSRVKTWTRHADLFEKDFILIPINEHAHWFLAIICFPGMNDAVWHPFHPRMSANDNGNAAAEQSQQEPEPMETEAPHENGEEGGALKEIRGSPVDVQLCLEGEEKSDFNLGLKQPCILIFDSLAGPSRTNVIKILKEYMQVEWDSRKSEKRNLREAMKGRNVQVPQQTNYSDCGVYVLQYAECFFYDKIMDFSLPMKGLKTWFKDEVVLRKRDEIRELILDLAKRTQTDNSAAS
ncbi:sentrin-specific protease 6-like [Gigantopelta aegis]|uniref:sentrin-specific protease 6-like n=1 Tax=Gigantopelta aegis TaxID=1735272 RepID=UPI001B88C61B|nr:sentrin-specific protease 6-like [Gigantopelta aegis]